MTLNDCILVGNGTSLLDHDHGNLIDAHRVVCRFNAVKLTGFEKHAGTRTTTWFTVLKYDAKKVEALNPQSIVAHSWEPDIQKCKTFQGYHEHAGWWGVTKLTHGIIPEINAYMADDSYKTWSTGALAIWLALRGFARVTIVGFDWWSRAEHHYADKAVRGNLHKPEVEKRFVDKLAADGRVQFLDAPCSRDNITKDSWPCPRCAAVDHDDAGDRCHNQV